MFHLDEDDLKRYTQNRKMFNAFNDIGLRILLIDYYSNIRVYNVKKFCKFCMDFIPNRNDAGFYSAVNEIINTYFDEKFRHIVCLEATIGYYLAFKYKYFKDSCLFSIKRVTDKVKPHNYKNISVKYLTSTYEDRMHADTINNLPHKNVKCTINHDNETPVLSVLLSIRLYRQQYENTEKTLLALDIPRREIRKIRKRVELLKDTKQTFKDVLERYNINHSVDDLYNHLVKQRSNDDHELLETYYYRFIQALLMNLSNENIMKIRKYKSGELSSEDEPYDGPRNSFDTNSIKQELDTRRTANTYGAFTEDDTYEFASDVYKHLVNNASNDFLMNCFTDKTSDKYTEFVKSVPSKIIKHINNLIDYPYPHYDKDIRLRHLLYLIIDFIYMQPENKQKDIMDILRTCLRDCDGVCNRGIFCRLMVTIHPFIDNKIINRGIGTEIGDSFGVKVSKLSEKNEDLGDLIANNDIFGFKELLNKKYLESIIDEYVKEYEGIANREAIIEIIKVILNRY